MEGGGCLSIFEGARVGSNRGAEMNQVWEGVALKDERPLDPSTTQSQPWRYESNRTPLDRRGVEN